MPGVGPRAAQRMSLHLLQHDRDGARNLANALERASEVVHHCERCNTFTEDTLCGLCRSPRRDATQLCVVETPADLMMVEQTQAYSGLYYVLMGRLSPLDGIGPREIRLDRLLKRALDGTVREAILADQLHARRRATAQTSASCSRREAQVSGSRAASGRRRAQYFDSVRWRRPCASGGRLP